MRDNFLTRDHLRDHVANDGFEIGDFTYGHPAIHWWGEAARLKIGRFCAIADDVSIFLGGNHRPDWVTTYPFSDLTDDWPEAIGIKGHPATKGDVTVGNDVWLGNRAVVLSGVTIGDGAVIGASALVAKDVPPYAVVVGNPARIVRYRFDPRTIERLLRLAWWSWPVERIKRSLPSMLSDDIEGFLTENNG